MKSIIITAAMAVACVASWAQSYTVSGTINSEANGKTVYLTTRGQNDPAPVKHDSCVIANGQFTLKHATEVPELAFISIEKFSDSFVMEPGEVKVEATLGEELKIVATGTKGNEGFAKYKQAYASYVERLTPLRTQLQGGNLSAEQTDSLRKKWFEYQDVFYNGLDELCEANYDNYLGMYLLPQLFSNWPLEKTAAYLEKVPENLRKVAHYEAIKNQIETLKRTAEGQPYTDIAGTSPDGQQIKLSDLVAKNKLVLVDFWATWCGPCMNELPNVIKAYETYHAKGLEILGVSLDNKEDAWKSTVKEKNMAWPQISDLKGWKCEAAAAYGVRAIPATVLIGQDGKIIKRDLRGPELLKTLEEMLK